MQYLRARDGRENFGAARLSSDRYGVISLFVVFLHG